MIRIIIYKKNYPEFIDLSFVIVILTFLTNSITFEFYQLGFFQRCLFGLNEYGQSDHRKYLKNLLQVTSLLTHDYVNYSHGFAAVSWIVSLNLFPFNIILNHTSETFINCC